MLVDKKMATERADIGIAKSFNITRSQSQKKIKEGIITVDGQEIQPKEILEEGALIEWNDLQRKTSKVPIMYEDESIIVINKPAGITTHPAPGENDLTICEILSKKLNFPAGEKNPGIVHRLDKGTSGIMVIAKNPVVKKKLQSQFKRHNIKKTYLSLVKGRLKPLTGFIDIPLSRDRTNRSRIGISANGREARTKYKVLKNISGYSYLELTPETGRTHQIRVHLSSIGFPIVGDMKYGQKSDLNNRIFLHASRIEFFHPVSNKKIYFKSDLPPELEETIKLLTAKE